MRHIAEPMPSELLDCPVVGVATRPEMREQSAHLLVGGVQSELERLAGHSRRGLIPAHSQPPAIAAAARAFAPRRP